jgi:peptide deformylase
MRKIVLYPNKKLRVKTEEVKEVTGKLLKEVGDLVEVLAASENGAGLAATQVGYKSRFLGIKKEKKILVMINPQIIKTYGKKVYPVIENDKGEKEDFLEGCLSFPNLYGTVRRFLKVEVSWEQIKGKKLVKKQQLMEGFEAIVAQHEMDHLEGVLFVDHIKRDGGKLYRFVGKERIDWNINGMVEEERNTGKCDDNV